jgi:hypothetical protein
MDKHSKLQAVKKIYSEPLQIIKINSLQTITGTKNPLLFLIRASGSNKSLEIQITTWN